MLPPLDEAVLKQNPDFDRLYKTLTTSLLNPDGSTRSNDPAAKKREAVHNELRAYRLKATKQHLLRRAIAAAASPEPSSRTNANSSAASSKLQPPQQDLSQPNRRTRPRPQTQTSTQTQAPPAEILDLLLLLPPFLSNPTSLSPSALALLLSRPPFSDLPSLFPLLTATISTTLSRQAGSLARVLNPHTNPSYIHRSVPALASTTTALLSTISSSSLALSLARQRAAYDLASHLSQHAAIIAQLVRVLESKHGPAARSAELRAEEANLSVRAWTLAAEALLWDARRTVYPPEARRALINYKRHLGNARMRLADTLRMRQVELEDYGVTPAENGGHGDVGEQSNKERTMREMARVWREMESRLHEVKGDLDRLR
ncbi:uncharacterized protein F4812DRAFT_196620 [Daldinia caldariorum]|uniref:uncharacterized protein n=1 Tax=Daldinia caldariorum TaxID=326644 RepID=UPI00200873A8|nr:uncharacterized protein F4812DRAFT_196620 [Daldinia caldariorum]KAI1471859.1 hypothetical protein F4812DRAFT_196620 [Daldinia caldariorum]